MKINYDEQTDAAFIKLSENIPDGAVELDLGLIVHTTKDNRIVAIEILDASKRFQISELFRFEVENLRYAV
ncbi:MAG: DUF2283 domain-containing protein [Ignavibacteria bacterium]|nr:DUF2283 domain-containing protein [Ignavibacteria bacterium]